MAQTPTCVYCRAEPVVERYKPFCSERCKMADLGRWLKGDYAVPATDKRGIDDSAIGDLAIEHPEIEDEQ